MHTYTSPIFNLSQVPDPLSCILQFTLSLSNGVHTDLCLSFINQQHIVEAGFSFTSSLFSYSITHFYFLAYQARLLILPTCFLTDSLGTVLALAPTPSPLILSSSIYTNKLWGHSVVEVPLRLSAPCQGGSPVPWPTYRLGVALDHKSKVHRKSSTFPRWIPNRRSSHIVGRTRGCR
jgi:hypothetical protein